ncbi:uncharacterized protein LOC132196637 [Neocloeon triangulifer]|uniref:uncharacterized protein LOC132196637 n=1 Tax=Neocloeon triangulifer TaxID=2078957 RepID=UPI00286F571B|nr:uncharacterized protein LOC132196637 [Neocloeon triangulifer]
MEQDEGATSVADEDSLDLQETVAEAEYIDISDDDDESLEEFPSSTKRQSEKLLGRYGKNKRLKLKASSRLLAKERKTDDDNLPIDRFLASQPGFTTEEQIILLKAVNEHRNDVASIQKMLPHRSLSEIALYLQRRKSVGMKLPYKKKSTRDLPSLSNIDSWVSALSKTRSQLVKMELSWALQMIAQHEKHPPPEKCGGIDFKKMYLYLSQVVNGDAPSELSPQNMALLAASVNMVQSHTTQLEFGPALHKVIKDLKARDMENIKKKVKTYSGIKNTQAENVCWEDETGFNPLKIKNDLLSMDPDKVHQLPLTTEVSEPIPRSTNEKIFFDKNGVPFESDLVFNALRLEERPTITSIRCNGDDIYIQMPNVTSESLKKVHFTCDDAYPKPLSTIHIDVERDSSNLLTSVIPKDMITVASCGPDKETKIINLEQCKVAISRSRIVHKLPKDESTATDIQFFPKYTPKGDLNPSFQHYSVPVTVRKE